MIVCALQSFQRKVNQYGRKALFLATSLICQTIMNTEVSVQISFEVFLLTPSYTEIVAVVTISLIKTKINKSRLGLFNCEVPRSSVLYGTRLLAAINFKGEGGKNLVYSQSFSGHRGCFAIHARWCDFRECFN